MRTKYCDVSLDYRSFSNPYKALAAMIFIQADFDLRSLKGEESAYRGGSLIKKWEIINFLRSPWAETLASGIGLDIAEIEKYEKRRLKGRAEN